MSAAESVEIMNRGAVVFLVRGLNPALGHRGIGVAETKLCDDHGLCAAVVRFNRGGGSRAAAADDKDVHVVIGLRKIDLHIQNARAAFEQRRQLVKDFPALVGADLQFLISRSNIVGMKGSEHLVLFLGRHSADIRAETGSARRFHLFHGHCLFFGVLIHTLLLIFLFLYGYKALSFPRSAFASGFR